MPRRDRRTLLAGLFAWIVGATFFFRQALFSSFEMTFGNVSDGSLIAFTREHLFQALIGRADWLSPPFFYPQIKVLGYTDALVLDLATYAPLRFLGFDPLLASQLMLILLSLLSFLATTVICLRYLGVSPILAICAAVLITFPNNLFFKASVGHTNFFSLYYVPCIALLGLWGLEAFPRLNAWSALRIAVAAALFGLLFATTYNIAWFFALTAMIAAGVAVYLLRPELAALLRSHPKSIGLALAAAIVGFVLGLIPFLLIYVPVIAIVPGRTFGEYTFLSPTPPDVINVSQGNLIWGWLVDRLRLLKNEHELPLATTPIMTVALIAFTLSLRKHETSLGTRSWHMIFAMCCVLVWAISWLLTVRYKGYSLFWFVFQTMPGVSGIRAGGRIQLLVNLWVVLGLVVVLSRWIDARPAASKRKAKLLAGGLVLLAITEQINTWRAAALPRAEQLEWLASVPSPPVGCKAFVLDPRSKMPKFTFLETDGMWMTLKIGLPTINGASGWQPRGWPIADDPAEYFKRLRVWLVGNNVTAGICVYQRVQPRWLELDSDWFASPGSAQRP